MFPSHKGSLIEQEQIVNVILFGLFGLVGSSKLAMSLNGDGMYRWGGGATILVILSCAILSGAACAQPTATPSFETASVKLSQSRIGHEGTFTAGPDGVTARKTTLKRLIYEAWQVGYARITGNGLPEWISTEEYDIDAKASHPVSSPELRQMLKTLLENRFKLTVRTESRVTRAYPLRVGKDGAKLHGPVGEERPGIWRFHGTLGQFAQEGRCCSPRCPYHGSVSRTQ